MSEHKYFVNGKQLTKEQYDVFYYNEVPEGMKKQIETLQAEHKIMKELVYDAVDILDNILFKSKMEQNDFNTLLGERMLDYKMKAIKATTAQNALKQLEVR